MKKYTGDFKVGDRVKGVDPRGENYYGTIVQINKKSNCGSDCMTVSKDSPSLDQWYSHRKLDGSWGAYEADGTLTLLTKEESALFKLKS